MVCYIGVGSNLGNRRQNIRDAVVHLREVKGISIKRSSAIYETQAEGGPESQGDYFNLVLEVDSKLKPCVLLKHLKEIEKEVGRRERQERWSAREIDLDILSCDAVVIREENLKIPHPLMHERFFVLKPLSDLAPLWRHPVLDLDATTMLGRLKWEGRWRKIEETL